MSARTDLGTTLEEYHYIWLSNHPSRDLDWLSRALKDGFDIHHIDGDHTNNDPANLVLIECQDHLFLHRGKLNRIQQVKPNGVKKTGLSVNRQEDCDSIFKLREDGNSWQEIKSQTGLTISKAKLMASKGSSRAFKDVWNKRQTIPFPLYKKGSL